MPIIYSYPTKADPTGNDLLIISDVSNVNRTRKITIAGIQTALNLVDGSGTANRIPLWVDSNTLADSSFEQSLVGGGVFQVGTQESVYIGKLTNESTTATIPQHNVGIGDLTLSLFRAGVDGNGNETAGENVAVGYQALNILSTGTNNVGLGVETLSSLDTGSNNIAIGKRSLGSLVGEQRGNISLGFDALGDLATGQGNVAVGQSAFDVVSTADNSVSLGFRVGKSFTGNIDGSVTVGNNILVSSTATSIEDAVLIGRNAGQQTTGSLKDDILIGVNSGGTGSSEGSNIAIGSRAGTGSTSISRTGSITIGTTGGANTGSGGTAESYATVIGSYDFGDVSLGGRNTSEGKYSAIIGGLGNSNSADFGIIVGGRANVIQAGALNGSILGGFSNQISSSAGSAGFAIGSNIVVAGQNQLVTGRYNVSNTNTKFIVGTGTGAAALKNGFEVLNTGQIRLAAYGVSQGGVDVPFPQNIANVWTVCSISKNDGKLTQVTQEEAARIPRYLSVNRRTVTSGINVNLPSNIGNVEKISWTGADGSVDLRLAALTPDNRVITFIADSSVTGVGKILNIKFSGSTIITLSYDAINTATVWYDKLASPAVFDVISCCSSTPSGGSSIPASSPTPPASSPTPPADTP